METTKINAKTTKAELIEIIKQQEIKLKEKNSLVDNPAKEMKEAQNKKMLESATQAIDSGSFSDKIIQEYKDVTGSIELKKQELQDLYGIEAEAETLVALINGRKEMILVTEQEYDEKHTVLRKEYEEEKAILDAQLAEMRAEKVAMIQALEDEEKRIRSEIEVRRSREEEEYTYSMERLKKEETDAWEDQKKQWIKEIAEKERVVDANMKKMLDDTAHIQDLEQKVADMPKLIESVRKEAEKEGKEKAERAYSFELRSIKTANEYEQKALSTKVESLEKELEAAKNLNVTLQQKLDNAYAQMRELAAETVKANGGVKILSGENSGK